GSKGACLVVILFTDRAAGADHERTAEGRGVDPGSHQTGQRTLGRLDRSVPTQCGGGSVLYPRGRGLSAAAIELKEYLGHGRVENLSPATEHDRPCGSGESRLLWHGHSSSWESFPPPSLRARRDAS